MKASELRPGQFFEFTGDDAKERFRALESLYVGRVWYMNSHFQLFWCGLDCEVVAVAGWDDEASESEAKQLNIDSGDEKFELARALHRVVRAMHDGHCPKCGHLASSMEFELSEGYHCCPECLFAITKEEADEALAMFLPYMQKNYDKFAAWQLHGRFVKPVEPAPSTPEPFRAGDLVVCVDASPHATGRCVLSNEAIYKVQEIDQLGKTVYSLFLQGIFATDGDGRRLSFQPSRFRHATAAEIEQYMQSHPEARSKSMQKRIEAMTEPKPLQLAEGKYYERRDGKVVGPVKLCRDLGEPWEYIVAGYSYRSDGTQAIEDEESEADIIREAPPPPSEQKRQDDEGWIEWAGGDNCPLPKGTNTELKVRFGTTATVDNPEDFRWYHLNDSSDITHYRVVEQPPSLSDAIAAKCKEIDETIGPNPWPMNQPAKYRPFASGEEFRPHRDRWLRCKEGHIYRVILVSELGVRIAWMTSLIQFDEMFNTFVFDNNGEPCGVME